MPLQPGCRLVRPRYGSAFTGSGGIILFVGGHLGLALLEQGGHGPGHGLNAFRLLFRQGDWKLIYWHPDQKFELFNLKEDISEEHNLAFGPCAP